MRSVRRSEEPALLGGLRSVFNGWRNLDRQSGVRIREALRQDFGQVCAYCQRLCECSDSTGTRPSAETIDHFRPRNYFPDLSFDWLNLVYACQRCNKTKGSKWPGYADLTNKFLVHEDSRYTPVTGYVNPSALEGQRQTSEFFGFDLSTGDIVPAEQLHHVEWSMAYRTIRDMDLNDQMSQYDPGNLSNLRLEQRSLLFEKLNEVGDVKLQAQILREFSQPDKPFSTFISAYVSSTWPQLDQLFPGA